MKNILLIYSFLLISFFGFSQIGIGTILPDAALDITSGNEGLLIPRVALTGTDDMSTILTPKASEMVYNTATAGAGATAVQPGYYYLSTDTGPWTWINNGPASSDWKITGNSDTNPTDNFLGTTNNQGLSIKTNNLERIRVTDAGNVGIGTPSPSEKLGVVGNISVTGQVNATGQVLSGEWLRNSNGSMGLYNNALDNHFAAVSDADWRITGNTNSCGLGFGSNNFSTLYGYAYADAAGIGFLGATRSWAIRNQDGLTQFSQNGPNDDGLLLSQSIDNTSSIQNYIDGQNTHAAIAAYAADANFILGLQPTKGRVGIGTLAPASKLTVATATNVAGIEHTDGTTRLVTYVNGTAAYLQTQTNHGLYLGTNGGSPTVTLAPNGDVGILIQSNPNSVASINANLFQVGKTSYQIRSDITTLATIYTFNGGSVALPVANSTNQGRLLHIITTAATTVTAASIYSNGANVASVSCPIGMKVFVCDGTRWYVNN